TLFRSATGAFGQGSVTVQLVIASVLPGRGADEPVDAGIVGRAPVSSLRARRAHLIALTVVAVGALLIRVELAHVHAGARPNAARQIGKQCRAAVLVLVTLDVAAREHAHELPLAIRVVCASLRELTRTDLLFGRIRARPETERDAGHQPDRGNHRTARSHASHLRI